MKPDCSLCSDFEDSFDNANTGITPLNENTSSISSLPSSVEPLLTQPVEYPLHGFFGGMEVALAQQLDAAVLDHLRMAFATPQFAGECPGLGDHLIDGPRSGYELGDLSVRAKLERHR